MNIGGYQPCSLCDYPGKVAAVLFTQGCNFRCPFCHNADLQPMRAKNFLDSDMILARIIQRKKCIDSIVVTGGEPTIHADLPVLLGKIRAAGLFVKLDTNGSNPALLDRLIRTGLVDFIAMDVKAPFAKYKLLAGVRTSTDAVRESIRIIEQSGLAHEFRTTVVPNLLHEDDIAAIRKMLPAGAVHCLQAYRSPQINNGRTAKLPFCKKSS
jgi:pyruvate formate lyase activating enzyme